MLQNDSIVYVYNYETISYAVTVPSNPNGIIIQGGKENKPNIMPLQFSDVKFINAQTDIIRSGKIRFSKEDESEIYESLKIKDWKTIKGLDELREILLDRSLNNLKKISEIDSINDLERMKRLVAVDVANEKVFDHNVITVVNERYEEITSGVKNKNSFISRKLVVAEDERVKNEALLAVEELKKEKEQSDAQVNMLMEQLKAMQEQMAKLSEEKKEKSKKENK